MRILRNKPRIKKLHALAANPTVDLWALDEVHFCQHGSRCRMWIPPEIKDPILLHHPTRKSIGYFGAVRLSDGKFVFSRENNKFNAQTFWNFLQKLKKQSRKNGKRIEVIIDNARFHHAKMHRRWRDRNQKSFSLNYLPPYSPDLNPIERVWKLTRKLCLHDQYFSQLTHVIDVVEKQFRTWQKGNEVLRKLCTV